MGRCGSKDFGISLTAIAFAQCTEGAAFVYLVALWLGRDGRRWGCFAGYLRILLCLLCFSLKFHSKNFQGPDHGQVGVMHRGGPNLGKYVGNAIGLKKGMIRHLSCVSRIGSTSI